MRSILKTLGGATLAMVVLTGCSTTQATTPATELTATATPAASVVVPTTAPAAVGTPSEATPEKTSSRDCVAGWEGWWNAIPVDGNDEGLPQQTVTVLTDTGAIIDAFDRDSQSGGSPEELGIDYQVQPDPDWPADSAVIIDVDTDQVIETITIPENETVCDGS
jgi:hypothetical protein